MIIRPCSQAVKARACKTRFVGSNPTTDSNFYMAAGCKCTLFVITNRGVGMRPARPPIYAPTAGLIAAALSRRETPTRSPARKLSKGEHSWQKLANTAIAAPLSAGNSSL